VPACALRADRHEDTMSYVIKQQGLKGVDLPRSGLHEHAPGADGGKIAVLRKSCTELNFNGPLLRRRVICI